jgi:hypothetical protein
MLYIDPSAYRDETDEKLTKETLHATGRLVNEDMASLAGYEGWETKFINVPVKARSRQ